MTSVPASHPPEPMNIEPLEVKVDMTEELKAEFEKLRNQNRTFVICFYLQSLAILILTFGPLLQ
jgi:hypothetical protein